MTARTWRWIVVLALVATALIGIASALNIDFVNRIIRPHQAPVQCQESPECRRYIDKQIDAVIRSLIDGGKGVVAGGGNGTPHGQAPPGGGQPGGHPGGQNGGSNPGSGTTPGAGGGTSGGTGTGSGGGSSGGGNTLELPPICAGVGTIHGCTPPITVGPLR